MTARWHALSDALSAIATKAEAAYAAVPHASDETRDYAREYAAAMDSIRENLLRATKAAAPQEAGR